jgi:hypothetical protein
MLRNGTARRSDSPWASSLHLVPKKEDRWKPCGDYRALKLGPSPTNIPFGTLPTFAQYADRKDFSTRDLLKAYYQIPVHPDGEHGFRIT